MSKLALSVLILFLFALHPASGAESKWFETDGAKIRLVSTVSPHTAKPIAGLQIELQPGWKTYWRSPGGSGLPPQFNFGQSKNIAKHEVHYPTPITFGDADNLTVGYNSSVLFPIEIEPLFKNRPMELNVDGLVGICAEICVPVQFKLSLNLGADTLTSSQVAKAFNQAIYATPSGPDEDFQISYAKAVDGTLEVAVVTPKDTQQATLFVEGPSDWYLIPAKAKKIGAHFSLFDVSLKDIPKSADVKGQLLRFTVVTDNRALDQKWPIAE